MRMLTRGNRGVVCCRQQRGARRGTRRISIHPNFIQRFSIANPATGSPTTLSPTSLRPNAEARHRRGSTVATESVMTQRNEGSTGDTPSNEQENDDKTSATGTQANPTAVHFGELQ